MKKSYKFGDIVCTPDGEGMIIGRAVDEQNVQTGWFVSIRREDFIKEPKPVGPCSLRAYTFTEVIDPA